MAVGNCCLSVASVRWACQRTAAGRGLVWVRGRAPSIAHMWRGLPYNNRYGTGRVDMHAHSAYIVQLFRLFIDCCKRVRLFHNGRNGREIKAENCTKQEAPPGGKRQTIISQILLFQEFYFCGVYYTCSRFAAAFDDRSPRTAQEEELAGSSSRLHPLTDVQTRFFGP